MSVTACDILHYQAANMPTADTGASGGDITSTRVTAANVGEALPNQKANAAGGADRTQYQKVCYNNNNSTDSAYSMVFWLPLSLDDITAAGALNITIANATDATDTTVTIYGQGMSDDATPVQEYQTEAFSIAGTITAVTGSKVFEDGAGGIIAAKITSTATGAQKTLATVDVEIRQGTQLLGKIPQGYHSAHGNIYMAMEAALNSTQQVTDRTTAPTDEAATPAALTFTKPNLEASGLSAAGTMTAGDFQGIWLKQVAYAGTGNLSSFQGRIAFSGSDA
jgi:hypothetical protein